CATAMPRRCATSGRALTETRFIPIDRQSGTCSTPGMADHLLVEKQGHVVTVTMNRPEARNAFSPEMMARLADAWDLIDGDPEVRAAILTGAGGHFCAGADLKLMGGQWPEDQWRARFK